MKTLRCILVDDDEIARLGLTYFIKKSGVFDLVGAFSNAQDALEFLKEALVDVLFLDIDMPDLTGFDLRKQVMTIPVCVFISAYTGYAFESYGLNALDFIQKPIKAERFELTVQKILDYIELHKKAEQFDTHFSGEHIMIKDKDGQVKVKLYDILYLEADKNYTQIRTPEQEYSVLGAFSSLLEKEHFSAFIRVHKSFAVQKHFVKKVLSDEVILINDMVIPIGRSYKDNLKLLLT